MKKNACKLLTFGAVLSAMVFAGSSASAVDPSSCSDFSGAWASDQNGALLDIKQISCDQIYFSQSGQIAQEGNPIVFDPSWTIPGEKIEKHEFDTYTRTLLRWVRARSVLRFDQQWVNSEGLEPPYAYTYTELKLIDGSSGAKRLRLSQHKPDYHIPPRVVMFSKVEQ